ncbi:hypothetical protein GJ496_006517 [Pomphorhynchus laevis]|nr:hypothetical protein GJ496_006517 [Pomphorhynchus laevis]
MDAIQRELNLRFLASSSQHTDRPQQSGQSLANLNRPLLSETSNINDTTNKPFCNQNVDYSGVIQSQTQQSNVENQSPVMNKKTRRSRNKTKTNIQALNPSDLIQPNLIQSWYSTPIIGPLLHSNYINPISLDKQLHYNVHYNDGMPSLPIDYLNHAGGFIMPQIPNIFPLESSINQGGRFPYPIDKTPRTRLGFTRYSSPYVCQSTNADSSLPSSMHRRRKPFVIKPSPKLLSMTPNSDDCSLVSKQPSIQWGRAHWAIANSIFCGVVAPREGAMYPSFRISIYNQRFNTPLAFAEREETPRINKCDHQSSTKRTQKIKDVSTVLTKQQRSVTDSSSSTTINLPSIPSNNTFNTYTVPNFNPFNQYLSLQLLAQHNAAMQTAAQIAAQGHMTKENANEKRPENSRKIGRDNPSTENYFVDKLENMSSDKDAENKDLEEVPSKRRLTKRE